MSGTGNEIVVYHPDETVRLDVRVEGETVWLNQSQLCELFAVVKSNVSYHLKNIFGTKELDYAATVQKIRTVRREGGRAVARSVEYFNLDVIISLGFRINSRRGIQFRQWATGVLKEYLLRGQAVNRRMELLEDKVDRRLQAHDGRIAALEGKVDFFVQTQTPPLRGVFCDGQLWDACSFAEKLIGRAQSHILLFDGWVGPETLDLLAKKRKGVKAEIVTSARGNKLAASDIAKFDAQYPTLSVRTSAEFHDRFLVLDDRELYLIGASLKDLGKKCFGFTRMDAREIGNLKARL